MNNDRNNTPHPKTGVPLKNYGSQAYPEGQIYLDAKQINNFQKSIDEAGLDGNTMNTGFVFLHESLHTRFGASFFNSMTDNKQKVGGRFRDPSGAFGKTYSAGNTVDRVNTFRRELGLAERTTYSPHNPNNLGSIILSLNGTSKEVTIKNQPLNN